MDHNLKKCWNQIGNTVFSSIYFPVFSLFLHKPSKNKMIWIIGQLLRNSIGMFSKVKARAADHGLQVRGTGGEHSSVKAGLPIG